MEGSGLGLTLSPQSLLQLSQINFINSLDSPKWIPINERIRIENVSEEISGSWNICLHLILKNKCFQKEAVKPPARGLVIGFDPKVKNYIGKTSSFMTLFISKRSIYSPLKMIDSAFLDIQVLVPNSAKIEYW